MPLSRTGSTGTMAHMQDVVVCLVVTSPTMYSLTSACTYEFDSIITIDSRFYVIYDVSQRILATVFK